jgi:hypothetical protein
MKILITFKPENQPVQVDRIESDYLRIVKNVVFIGKEEKQIKLDKIIYFEVYQD